MWGPLFSFDLLAIIQRKPHRVFKFSVNVNTQGIHHHDTKGPFFSAAGFYKHVHVSRCSWPELAIMGCETPQAINDTIFPQGQPLPKLEFLKKKPLITGVSQQLLCTSEP